MSALDKAVKELIQVLTEPRKNQTSPYDTQAEVIRVDGNIAWVHIPGGVDETPVRLTMNAQVGDTVQVRVSGGNAWLQGNATSPPTDDTTANKAVDMSSASMVAAESAIKDAIRASEAAMRAEQTAEEVEQIAVDAQTAAENTKQAANTAFNHLAVVENIVGVLNMVAEHGEYSENPSTDTTVQPEKWYFVRSGSGTAQDPYTYEIVQNAQDDYIYFLTEDTEIVEGKTYYTRSGSGTEQDPYVYTPVENPNVQYISTYYERTNSPNLHGWYELVSIDEAIQNYVINHLALDNSGLWLQSDGAAKILLSTTRGIVLYDNNNNELASYGSTSVIGNKQDFHIEIGRYYALTTDEAIVQDKTYYIRSGTYPNYVYTEVQSPDVSEISTYYELMAPQIGFYQGENKVAYMGSSELYVENNLSFGNFVFTQRNNGHFTLKLIG